MEYLVTFFTHSGAIKFERFVKSIGLDITLMPVPRKFSSNCGIAAKICFYDDLSKLIIDDIERIFMLTGNDSELVYSAD